MKNFNFLFLTEILFILTKNSKIQNRKINFLSLKIKIPKLKESTLCYLSGNTSATKKSFSKKFLIIFPFVIG